MPRVRTIFISQHRDTPESWRKGLKVIVSVNAKGFFYCALPAGLYLPLLNVFSKSELIENKDKGTVQVFADTLESLQNGIQKAFNQYTKPTVKEEPVICYNIETHVSFATDKNQNIFPNGYYPGAEWPGKESAGMYGDHHAADQAPGGYSIVVGAKAMVKTTRSYGSQDKVSYERYYKNGNHLGRDNPAERLNSWVSFTLGENFKEIPYSDEAAEFFFNLMYGVARLAQMIQNNTFEKENLLALVFSGKYLMPGTAPPSSPQQATGYPVED